MPEEFGEHLIRDQRPFSSYRISPDPSDSQLHDSASSLQFTSLIFYRVQVRVLGRPWQKLPFVLSDTYLCWFWCLFWIIVLMEDPTTAHIRFLKENISEVYSHSYLHFLAHPGDLVHDIVQPWLPVPQDYKCQLIKKKSKPDWPHISRGANNCGQHALEKKHLFHHEIFSPFSIVLLQLFLWIFWMKDQKHKRCRFIFTADFAHIYQGCQY